MKRSPRNKQTPLNDFHAHAQRLGIDARVLGRAIARYPRLRSRLDALAENAGVCARILRLRRTEFVRLALTTPELIDVPAAKLLTNIRSGSDILDVPAETFWQLAIRSPILLALEPEGWEALIARLARTLDCERERIRDLIVRTPEIVSWPPGRWQQKRREIEEVLGLDSGQMNLMILRYPRIISSKPATLRAHFRQLAKVLPLSKPELVSVLLRLPTLLRVNPDLLASKLPKLKAIGQLYGDTSVRDIVMLLPAALGYSHERLKERRELALAAKTRPSLATLLTMSAREAKLLLLGQKTTLPRRRSVRRSKTRP